MISQGKISIVGLFLTVIIIVATFIVSSIGILWISAEYKKFQNDSAHIRTEFISTQKSIIKEETDKAIEFISFSKSRTESRLKELIRNRTYEAYGIAMNIYLENVDWKRRTEIEKMVKDALRPIRFNDGRGYFFATNFDGIEMLFADKPDLENKDLSKLRNTEGKYVIQDMIRLAKEESEGFYEYLWTKPNVVGKSYPKIAFIKHFEPFDWFIGTGEYLDDVEDDIKYEVIQRLAAVRFNRNGYLFGSTYDGDPLFTNGQITKGSQNIINLTDPNGVKIIQSQIATVKESGEGFVRYSWQKLKESAPSPKISYVKGYDTWEWIVGAGFYVDEIETVISEKQRILNRQVQKNISNIVAILLTCLVFILILVRSLSLRMRRIFESFSDYFEKASKDHHPLEPKDLFFTDFYKLSASASRMIMERNRAENALMESEERYRVLLENSPLSVMAIQDQRFVYVNSMALRMIGLDSNDEIIGKHALDIVAPEYHDAIRNRMNSLEKTTFLPATELQLVRKDGTRIPVESTSVSVTFQGKKLILIMAQDITDRKKVEEELKRSNTKLINILDSISDGFFTLDNDMVFTYYNSAAERLLSREKEKVVGRKFLEAFPEVEGSVFEKNYQKAIEQKIDMKFEQYFEKKPLENWYQANVYAFDEGISVFFQVTTEQKRIEESLKENEKRLRLILDAVSDGVWDWNIRSGEVYFSDQWLESLGYGRTDLPASIDAWKRVIHPDDITRIEGILSAHFKGINTDFECEAHLKRKDGEYRYSLIRGKVVDRDQREKPLRMVGTVMDISERKKGEEERKKLESQLQQAQKIEAIGTLAGGIAHDFNNILFPIIGYAEMILEDAPKTGNVQRHIQEVLKAAKRAQDLVHQILTFSRESVKEYKPLLVQPIIKEALKLLRSIIPATISFEQNIERDSVPIMGDPTQIHQILINLCTNAYHAMEENGGTLEINLKRINLGKKDITSKINLKPGEYLRLSVTDTGVGIRPELMNKIFEPYFTTKEQGKGTGLGLSVVHGIVKSHSGAVTVYSEPGIGTTFHVYLPTIKTEAASLEVLSVKSVDKGTERILLVDDEEQIVVMESEMLEKMGYHVIGKTNSVEALQLFKTDPDYFDIVITDMTMPKLTGIELTKNIKAVKPDIPVIICTGFSEKISEEKASSLGINGYIMKPATRRELSECIRRVMDTPPHSGDPHPEPDAKDF